MSQQIEQSPTPSFEPTPANLNPTRLRRPSFLLNAPFSFSARVPNNKWMEEQPVDQREPDRARAMLQFLELYRYVSSEALVYLLPTPRGCDLQDLVFTANLGIVPQHHANGSTVIISNYTSVPRRGETAVGRAFFESMDYDVHVAPHRFEGEADLKHLYDDVYVGGYGMRSELATYEWMERTFGMKIIKVRIQGRVPVPPRLLGVPAHAGRHAGLHRGVRGGGSRRAGEGHEHHRRLRGRLLQRPDQLGPADELDPQRLEPVRAQGGHRGLRLRGEEKNRRLEDIASEHGFDVAYFNLENSSRVGRCSRA